MSKAVDQVRLADDDAANFSADGVEEAGLLFDAGVDRLDIYRQTAPPQIQSRPSSIYECEEAPAAAI